MSAKRRDRKIRKHKNTRKRYRGETESRGERTKSNVHRLEGTAMVERKRIKHRQPRKD